MSVFFFFALATVVGILSTLFWIPEDDLGRGYFQMNGLVVLGFLSLVLAVVLLHPFKPFGEEPLLGTSILWAGFVTCFLYYAAVWYERWTLARVAAIAALATCGAALLMAGPELIVGLGPLPHRGVLVVASLVSSSLLLGWSLTAMLLGHWYLVGIARRPR